MISFVKVRKVKSPVVGHRGDAGTDFFIPEDIDSEELQKINSTIIERKHSFDIILKDGYRVVAGIEILPHCRVLIPSGIHVNFQEGFMLKAENKSGVAHKKGLVVGSSVVDSSYMGEVHLSLINTTDKKVVIRAGEKVVQFILVECCTSPRLNEKKTLKDLYKYVDTTRGSGGFGSTTIK
jgi:dUTP pyrophosphatase